jgi:signal transduction histidine kinase
LFIQPVKSNKFILNPHLWFVIILTVFLAFIYQAWPWREWYFSTGTWKWFSWLSSLFPLALFEATNRVCGILFLIPIIYAALTLSWKGVLIVFLFSLAAVLPIVIGVYPINAIIATIALLIIPFLVISIISFELTWRRKERKILEDKEAVRREYITRMLEFQENERQRIAQEIHDDTIQSLLAIANQAEITSSFCDGDSNKVKDNIQRITNDTLKTVDDLRRISLDLRPNILDDLGLVAALRWLVDRVKNESSINLRICISGVERKLSSQKEIAIYRIAQEALNNIKRHSKATDASVSLDFVDSMLKIAIEDNGQGFATLEGTSNLLTYGKLGLAGIKGRVSLLGGKCEIRSNPGYGTSITVEILTD